MQEQLKAEYKALDQLPSIEVTQAAYKALHAICGTMGAPEAITIRTALCVLLQRAIDPDRV